jgi:predicted DNA binding CopG/RHH family protein
MSRSKITREELLKESEEWESGKRGGESKAAPEEVSRKLDHKLNLQMISLRLPVTVIGQLKQLAADEGLGYQPYVRQLLVNHVRNKAVNRSGK